MLSLELFISIASFMVAAAALVVALYTIRRADLTSSASVVVALNQGFLGSWRALLDAPQDRKSFEFAELMNGFEIAAGMYMQGTFCGIAKELLNDYLCRTLSLIINDDGGRNMFLKLKENQNTFKYIIQFIKFRKNSGRIESIEKLIEIDDGSIFGFKTL